MSVSLVLTKHEYCASCLQQADIIGKCLENYVFSDERIAYALQETELMLCTFCKRKAAQAEHFLSSIWNNQKLWNENDYTTQERLLEEKCDLPTFYNFIITKPILIDIYHEVRSPNEIVLNITYDPLSSKSPTSSPTKSVPLPIVDSSIKTEEPVKFEVSAEDEGMRRRDEVYCNEWNNLGEDNGYSDEKCSPPHQSSTGDNDIDKDDQEGHIWEKEEDAKDRTETSKVERNRVETNKVEINRENFKEDKLINQDKVRTQDNLQGKYIRERNYCSYCDNYILNFARHMVRQHKDEPEVKLALKHPKNSLERKKSFAELRKKGNFISNTKSNFKPVRKSRLHDKLDYLPCTKCLGFYARKLLWKHVKLCNNLSTDRPQVQAQNFLIGNSGADPNLVAKVFSRMSSDKISLVAKKDKLICMFGAELLRKERNRKDPKEHFSVVVSRKMRELAKLFIEVTKLKPNINTFEEMLKPEYYDTLVDATKTVARYNEETKQYNSPTYAMNIASSIKQCCNIALAEYSKVETTNTAQIQSDLKTLLKLITENWYSDVSRQAAHGLNTKKINKISIVPLVTDLKLLKDHLSRVTKESSDSLNGLSQDKTNVDAYNKLVESTFCRVLFLNRVRLGELQRFKINDYIVNTHDNDQHKSQNFSNLSLTEKILVDKLKKIVIRDIWGRRVVVLFNSEIQDDIKLILAVRHMYVKNDNMCLFAKADGDTVSGFKIMEKYAKACKAKNYKALTTIGLRKHLATMTQLFSMTESELEQLLLSVGLTVTVRKNNDSLSNDVYQISKVWKLLRLTEEGKADKYKGMALDDIDLDLDEDVKVDGIDLNENNEILVEESDEVELEEENPQSNEIQERNENLSNPNQILAVSNNVTSNNNLKETNNSKTHTKRRRILIPWTNEQKNVVTDFFSEHIKIRKPPKRAECEDLKSKYPELLQNKNWLKIKVFIQNTYARK